VTATAVAETVATCVQAGVDPYVFTTGEERRRMAFGTYFDRRQAHADGDFSPTFHGRADAEDAASPSSGARRQGPHADLEETTRTYEDAVASGWGKEDFSAVTT